jgi:hypothetical protein
MIGFTVILANVAGKIGDVVPTEAVDIDEAASIATLSCDDGSFVVAVIETDKLELVTSALHWAAARS